MLSTYLSAIKVSMFNICNSVWVFKLIAAHTITEQPPKATLKEILQGAKLYHGSLHTT